MLAHAVFDIVTCHKHKVGSVVTGKVKTFTDMVLRLL